MNIFTWMIFALVNAVVLFSMDYDPHKTTRVHGFILGIVGALSSSLFIYLVTKGVTPEFNMTFILVIIVEAALVSLLFVNKSVKNFRI